MSRQYRFFKLSIVDEPKKLTREQQREHDEAVARAWENIRDAQDLRKRVRANIGKLRALKKEADKIANNPGPWLGSP